VAKPLGTFFPASHDTDGASNPDSSNATATGTSTVAN
jgi:hypothetical protein